eukprot:IDg9165t1
MQSFLRVPNDVLSEIRNRSKRLFFFSYEGTLQNYAALEDLAAPTLSLRRILSVLASDPRNVVFILSGRSRQTLENWFGDISVGLVSEHGCEFRYPGMSKWEPLIVVHDPSWRDSVMPILEYFTERTPGSLIEKKNMVLTWHFRDADQVFGSWQAKELQLLLAETSMNLPIDVISSDNYIELRPVGVSRVVAVQRIITDMAETPPDFVLAMGSETADEQIFAYVHDVVAALQALEKLASSGSVARKLRLVPTPAAVALPAHRRRLLLPRSNVHRSSSYDTGMRAVSTASAEPFARSPLQQEPILPGRPFLPANISANGDAADLSFTGKYRALCFCLLHVGLIYPCVQDAAARCILPIVSLAKRVAASEAVSAHQQSALGTCAALASAISESGILQQRSCTAEFVTMYSDAEILLNMLERTVHVTAGNPQSRGSR